MSNNKVEINKVKDSLLRQRRELEKKLEMEMKTCKHAVVVLKLNKVVVGCLPFCAAIAVICKNIQFTNCSILAPIVLMLFTFHHPFPCTLKAAALADS